MEKSWGNNQSRKQITIIVDADDKNCLAQSTVAQKLDQGVRQGLYIIAGVLFFRSFFCTSKRKNIKYIPMDFRKLEKADFKSNSS